MAYSTISKPSLYFNTKTYTGTGSSNAQTGVGFQPDWLWIKNRGGTQRHNILDVIRGVTKRISSNTTDAEATNSYMLSSFDSDGFTLGTDQDSFGTNTNGSTYVAWNWKANGSGSSNSNGSITSTVSANTTAGFSIVSYTANGTQGATVGHGLSSAPEMVITKDRSVGTSSYNWGVYHIGLDSTSPEDKYIELNSISGVSDFTYWNDTKPSNTVVTLGDAVANNTNGSNVIMYCFHSVKGYSKFGSYTGNGSTDGAFIYTGFKPAFLLVKTYTTNGGWQIYDNKRNNGNPTAKFLVPSSNAAEASGSNDIDFLSNGFKTRTTANPGTTDSFIYMAFAAEPLVANVGQGIPATAV